MSSLERNLHNRKWLVEKLRAEIIGPDPSGQPININKDGTTTFSWSDWWLPKKQINGEEILWRDSPIKRYGAGILFPQGVTELLQLAEEAESENEITDSEIQLKATNIDEEIERDVEKHSPARSAGTDEDDNFDVNLSNSYRPSAMGLSFLGVLPHHDQTIGVEIEAAQYKRVLVKVAHEDSENFREMPLFLRQPIKSDSDQPLSISFNQSDVLNLAGVSSKNVPNTNGNLKVVLVARKVPEIINQNQRLITVSLVNQQTKLSGAIDEQCFFQCKFSVSMSSDEKWIFPYPEKQKSNNQPDDEEPINKLLYRDLNTFAIGHGCSADWEEGRPERVNKIWTDCMPAYETLSMKAELTDNEGNPISVSMRKLAGLDPDDDGFHEINNLVNCYSSWIRELKPIERRKPFISENLKPTAEILIQRCEKCLERIEKGIAFLKEETADSKLARKAFELTNYSILVSQLRASRDVREPTLKDGIISWDKEISIPDPAEPHATKGHWRPFQIAFILMSLPGICDPGHEDREIVDLIWFPTGGGKTEAYLGLTAFTIFFNRLTQRKITGADVIMRYTLRLLTTQQFERATLLFCAMEQVRKIPSNLRLLGDEKFRIGMWVGGDASPNDRNKAKSAFRNLEKDPDSENPFIILKCPWCNARMGPVSEKNLPNVIGYKIGTHKENGPETVVFNCRDPKCEYGDNPLGGYRPPLPVMIIDEDIFEDPPNLIIGTVDKFAMLTWKPQARAIFGINDNGFHTELPPSLIIQDELHLISGPLGSMVGLYETIIEELCSTQIENKSYRPKIVASTATISRAEEQVKNLYARQKSMLFPPSGLEAGDSFFARESRNKEGIPDPGRLYLGILAPGHGSQQTTQARIFATLLQYPAVMHVLDGDESERDPWWTLLAFFNSLRELGGAATLLVADTRDYLRVLINRHGFEYKQIRQLLNVMELTSRIRNDRIPMSIKRLEKPFSRNPRGFVNDSIEACLASNIIEVGIDIDRLSLMAIVGQPKTTAQYIQVSSRIGRKQSAPGLVVLSYSQSKPRDRSHYERFRSYHQKLYAQVEPTSVTPFSPPAVERALHSIIVAAVRQFSPISESTNPQPFPLERVSPLRQFVERIIKKRVSIIDRDECANVARMLSLRLSEWKAWDPYEYGGFGAAPTDPPLMHPAGTKEQAEWNGHSWPTMSSMRNVDANCEGEVTRFYNEPEERTEI